MSRIPEKPVCMVALTRADVELLAAAVNACEPHLFWLAIAASAACVWPLGSLLVLRQRWTWFDFGAALYGVLTIARLVVHRARTRRRWVQARRTVDRLLRESDSPNDPTVIGPNAFHAYPSIDQRWN